MSIESKEVFKQQVLQKRIQSRKKIKLKKSPVWLMPTAYYRQYKTFLKNYIKEYIQITNNKILPVLSLWSQEIKQTTDEDSMNNIILDTIIYDPNLKDQWEEELEEINESEFEKLNEKNKSYLKGKLLLTAILISTFNKKQFNKITEQQFGFQFSNYEGWEKTFLNAWVYRNINLIKNLADEYRKKINESIISNFNKGLSVAKLKEDLNKINNTFSEYRTELIAKDQINKINNQLSAQRMKDAGVDTYIWRTSRDERVRGNPSGTYPNAIPSHWMMEGLLCRWDDPTVYSDDNGASWKKRTSEMPKAHPGEEVNCRCFGEPNFQPLVEEVNSTQENLLG